MKLIDKDAVVSWVTEKREAALYRQHNLEKIGQETVLNEMIAFELTKIISFIDTLEVKEMNSNDAFIEKACEFWKDHLDGYDICEDDIERSIESFKLAMEL